MDKTMRIKLLIFTIAALIFTIAALYFVLEEKSSSKILLPDEYIEQNYEELSPPWNLKEKYSRGYYFDAQLVSDTITDSEVYDIFMEKYPFTVVENDLNQDTGLGYFHLVAEKDTHSIVLSFQNENPGEFFYLDLICIDWKDWEEGGIWSNDRIEFMDKSYMLWEEQDGFEDWKKAYQTTVNNIKITDCFEHVRTSKMT